MKVSVEIWKVVGVRENGVDEETRPNPVQIQMVAGGSSGGSVSGADAVSTGSIGVGSAGLGESVSSHANLGLEKEELGGDKVDCESASEDEGCSSADLFSGSSSDASSSSSDSSSSSGDGQDDEKDSSVVDSDDSHRR